MKITHKMMLSIIRAWLVRELVSSKVDNPIKITQNSHTGDFIIKFENEDAVKSILPPIGE